MMNDEEKRKQAQESKTRPPMFVIYPSSFIIHHSGKNRS
jgi:hypothetical protein